MIALIAAYVVWSGSLARRRRERRERKHADRPKKPPRWQEALSGGTARTTFLIGLLLSFPGASYLAALTAIDKQNFGIAGDLLVVIAVNIVMLALLEVPLIAFAVAPASTPIAIDRFRGWSRRSEAITIGLSVIGSHPARRLDGRGLSPRTTTQDALRVATGSGSRESRV